MRASMFVAIALGAGCASAGAPGTSGDDTGGGSGGAVDARVDVPVDACPDSDNDSACDNVDACPGFDDRTDTDADTVADGCDLCPGFDDRIDANMNMMPDACEIMTRTIDLKQVGTNYWRGWHASGSSHSSSNDNTLTGAYSGGTYNSYYVFSLAGFTAFSITEVTLELRFEAWTTSDATETFSIWDVTTPAATVETTTSSATIHSDLMTGVSYGTGMVSAAELNTVVSIPLNAAAATDVKAQLGNDFVVGAHLDTAPGWIRFGNTGANTIRLVVKYLP